MHNNTSHTTSDEILFYQIQQGNEDAFEALFLRHYPALCAYARLFVEPDDGQEIVSDVMVWLWENKEMQAFETSLKSYLFKAVKNRCLTLINRNEVKQRIEKMIFDNLQSQYDDPDFYVMQELTEKIEEALARLPENIREAFELTDVMVWLWENKEMQAFETSLKSYLFKAVKNRCLTLINRNEVKQRIEKMIFDNLQSQYDDPDFYVMQELTEKIEEALARLPENIREAFELNRFQNLTYNEIAERLGVSPKTIDYRIQQALKQLRIDLKDYLPVLLSFLLR